MNNLTPLSIRRDLENRHAVNAIYETVTGEKSDCVLADGFIALMPAKEDYEAEHGVGSFETYLYRQLQMALATECLTEDKDIDAVIEHFNIVEVPAQ